MSENLDLVRSIYADWERGDFSSAKWADPEIEYTFMGGWLDAGSGTGLAEMGARWRDWVRAWQDFEVEADEYREVDSERILVLARFRGRGKTSGLELAKMRMEAASLFHIRHGKVTRLALYGDRDRALADLGLAPEGDGADSPGERS
jgi:ketosteroid isomerase-like protein